jgi:two-component system nitrate/nitrite response regulator NarL
MNPTVLMVDRDLLFGAALGMLLVEDGYTAGPPLPGLGEAIEAVEGGRRADLLVVDPCGQPDAADRLRRLRWMMQPARLVVLSGETSDELLYASLQAGADAHLAKTASFDTLRHALRLVRLGEAVFPSRALELLEERPVEPAELWEGPAPGRLSQREMQILCCLLAGNSNKVIARRLAITESTVKMHFKNLMRKIHAQNRTQAAVWAVQHGIEPSA